MKRQNQFRTRWMRGCSYGVVIGVLAAGILIRSATVRGADRRSDKEPAVERAVSPAGPRIVAMRAGEERRTDAESAPAVVSPADYQWDDGTAETCIGVNNDIEGWPFGWANQFQNTTGRDITLASIEVAFGCPGTEEGVHPGDEAHGVIWIDRGATGDMRNVECPPAKQWPLEGGVHSGDADFKTFLIPDGGVTIPADAEFYVGLADIQTQNDRLIRYPASLDESSSALRSWYFPPSGTVFDPCNLGAQNLRLIDDFGYPGNWLIRANASKCIVPPGSDCWRTECGGTGLGFVGNPLPADFFDPGSKPFEGVVSLGGAGHGNFDTQWNRLDTMDLCPPALEASTDVELIFLDLVSCEPIVVQHQDGSTSQWSAQVRLSSIPPSSVGQLTAVKTHENGGVFHAAYPVQPRFTFSNVADPSKIRIYDWGQEGREPILLETLGDPPWVHQTAIPGSPFACGINFVPGVGETLVAGAVSGGQPSECCFQVIIVAPSQTQSPRPPDCSNCPSGACCLPSGLCEVANPTQRWTADMVCRLEMDGEYKGDFTNCADNDGDGIATVQERNDDCAPRPGSPLRQVCNRGTNPAKADTDDDGCSDRAEFSAGTSPCNPCEPDGGCPGMLGYSDCNANNKPDACDLANGASDCNGNKQLDVCETDLKGACCNTQSGCAELTKTACDSLSGWVFQGYCTHCPNQNVGTATHDGVAVVHYPTPVPECSITGAVAAREDCAGRQCLYDTWITDPDDPTCHNFNGTGPAPSIPAGFFGPGSDPFVGQVCFQGVPLGPTPFGDYGDADTIICRSADPFDRCALPSLTESTVPVQIVALSLLSRQPIVVTYNGGQNPELWNIAVALSDVPSPPGTLTAVKTHCNGGTYTSILPVQPKFTFAKVMDPNVRQTLDTGTIGGWPVFTLVQDAVPPAEDAPWVHDPRAELSVAMDPCTNFHPGIEETVQVPSCDCNANSLRDKCDLEGGSRDCNKNGIPDECELSGNDCNSNGVPDECEPDCNGNGVADGCDVPPPIGVCVANCSTDCNANGMPDECEPDCNRNGVPDGCELGLLAALDCQPNGRPDECDLASRSSVDCQQNGRPDECDVADGTSRDGNANTIPDECEPPPPPLRFPPDTNSTRALGMVVQSWATASGPATLAALRVTMVELHHPDPRNAPQFPPPNASRYSTFDTNTNGVCSGATTGPNYNGHPCNNTNPDCLGDNPNPAVTTDDGACSSLVACTAAGETNGCARWVGRPGTFLEAQDDQDLGSYRAARLQCTPYYHDWASEGVFYVMAAEIVPSSAYDVETFAASCQGHESTCTAVSSPLTIKTARFGDLASLFNPPDGSVQPDARDVSKVVDSFKHLASGLVKAIAKITPNLPEENIDVDANDISAVVDAAKGYAYKLGGPCPCPSTVICGDLPCPLGTDSVCTASLLPGLGPEAKCIKTCTGGPNDGEPCLNGKHCGNTCATGPKAGQLCDSDPDCGTGHTCTIVGTCGTPLCRDRCGRCN